jgi:hypothetical protein
MMATLQGYDSVSASGMPDDGAFYCFYSAGAFANGTAVKADHPSKLYLGITPTLSNVAGADCLDIENGDATPADAPSFVKSAQPPNLNLPALYASESNIAAINSACSAAGISRDKYYLFQADWNDADSLPAGVDIAQYENTPEYDKDIAASYVFKGSTPPIPPTPPKPPVVVTSGTQEGWSWCIKCGSLYWPTSAQNVCAAGGKHANTGSFTYSLDYKS